MAATPLVGQLFNWNVRPQVDSMLFPVHGTHILETAYCLPVFNILIKNSSDKGRGSRFTSFLGWSKSLHGFARIATSDESYTVYAVFLVWCFQCMYIFHT